MAHDLAAAAVSPPAIAPRRQRYAVTLTRLEHDLGGRDTIVELLALSPETRTTVYLLSLLTDQTQQTKSLGDLCALAEITPGALLRLIKEGQLLAAHVRSMQKAVEGAPQVVEAVMRQAQPHYEVCDACGGDGVLRKPQPDGTVDESVCRPCHGRGEVLHQPQVARQKLALDIVRLLPKGAPQVAVAVGIPAGGGSRGFDPAAFQAEAEVLDRQATLVQVIEGETKKKP
jgi:hypothetical protein